MLIVLNIPLPTPVVELQARMELIAEGVAVDGLLSPPSPCGIAALRHEVFDDPVEDGAVVVALQA
jgi:hypothetical protein